MAKIVQYYRIFHIFCAFYSANRLFLTVIRYYRFRIQNTTGKNYTTESNVHLNYNQNTLFTPNTHVDITVVSFEISICFT